jgi:hypothetical protein
MPAVAEVMPAVVTDNKAVTNPPGGLGNKKVDPSAVQLAGSNEQQGRLISSSWCRERLRHVLHSPNCKSDNCRSQDASTAARGKYQTRAWPTPKRTCIGRLHFRKLGRGVAIVLRHKHPQRRGQRYVLASVLVNDADQFLPRYRNQLRVRLRSQPIPAARRRCATAMTGATAPACRSTRYDPSFFRHRPLREECGLCLTNQ